MKTALKILFIPVVVFGLTAFGMLATTLAGRHPAPIANIGVTPVTPPVFNLYDGGQLAT